jgi:hypothetical protein
MAEWQKNPPGPYQEGDYRYWRGSSATQVFIAQTLTGFKVKYRLELLFERVNNDEFNRARMLDDYAKYSLVVHYNNEVFWSYFNDTSCFFGIQWRMVNRLGEDYGMASTPVCRLLPNNNDLAVGTMHDHEMESELRKLAPFIKNGCAVTINYFRRDIFDIELIEENYAMITDAQKQAILASDRYGAHEEMFAVAALKRRYDFLDKNEQKHETDHLSIETVKAGRGVKIKWRFTQMNPFPYELLGFRSTGGFYADQLRMSCRIIFSKNFDFPVPVPPQIYRCLSRSVREKPRLAARPGSLPKIKSFPGDGRIPFLYHFFSARHFFTPSLLPTNSCFQPF